MAAWAMRRKMIRMLCSGLWTPLSLVKVCHVPVEVLLKACKNWDMTETRGHYCSMLHITPLTMGARTSDVVTRAVTRASDQASDQGQWPGCPLVLTMGSHAGGGDKLSHSFLADLTPRGPGAWLWSSTCFCNSISVPSSVWSLNTN